MKYEYLILLAAALIIPAAAFNQVNISGDYRSVLSTFPEQPVVNTPVHIELHIQQMNRGNPAGDLNVEELIVHLQEHTGLEPHTSEGNISEIHKDIPHRIILDMMANPDEPPGHYHTNYTFNETGIYEVVTQFKNNGDNVTSVFSIEVKPDSIIKESFKIRYELAGIAAISFIILVAFAFVIRKISNKHNIK